MKGMFILLFILISLPIYADIKVSASCVTLADLLGEDYPAAEVQCNFEPGDIKKVSKSMVTSALRRIGAAEPELLFASYQVQRSGYQLAHEDIISELTAIYQDANPEAEVKIEKLRFMKTVWLADKNASYRFDVNGSEKGFVQGQILTEQEQFNIQFEVKLFEDGYVLTDRATKGDLLDDILEQTLVDTTNLRHSLVKTPTELVAVKSIAKGSTLTSDMVKEKPDLMKGDTVQLYYTSGRVSLEITAIADSDAIAGKNFQVMNPDSGKVFTALYQGNGVALVK